MLGGKLSNIGSFAMQDFRGTTKCNIVSEQFTYHNLKPEELSTESVVGRRRMYNYVKFHEAFHCMGLDFAPLDKKFQSFKFIEPYCYPIALTNSISHCKTRRDAIFPYSLCLVG